MYRIEKHIIKRGHDLFKFFDELSFSSKNIYNSTLYIIRQEFIRSGRTLSWMEALKVLRNDQPETYTSLPIKSTQHVSKLVGQNFKSFFAGLKSFQTNPKRFKARPKLPRYLEKSGRQVVTLTNQQCRINDGHFEFLTRLVKKRGLNFKPIRTKIKPNMKLIEARIVPKSESYNLEIVYEVPDRSLKSNEGLNVRTGEMFELHQNRFMSIDLGVSNFCTVSTNVDRDFFILNGRVIKSINQWTNKMQSSKLGQRKKNLIWNKRSNKLNHIFHHMTNYLIQKALEKGCKTIVVGKNDGWKQKASIGKRNNQNFIQIPFERFLHILDYKCYDAGIELVRVEESYTSKCSFLDLEELRRHENYSGRKIQRGMFKSKNGVLINADLNGSLNIARKVFPDAFKAEGIEGFVVNPYRVNFV